jgi:hypothetical protein
MKEQLMTIERWADPEVRTKVYSYFTDAFNLRDTTQSNGNVDIHKPVQDNRPSR